MNQKHNYFSYGLPVVVLALGSILFMQDKKGAPPAGQDPADMMKAMMEQMPKPGPEHAALMKDVGTWDAAQECQMAPGAPPMKSKGVATVSPFGQFFIHEDFKGDMMGAPFQGQSVVTYDPAKKKFVGTWHDTMMPMIMSFDGSYDAGSKTMTCTGEMPDHENPTVMTRCKMTTVWKDADHKTFTMYEVKDGKDNLMMTIEYTRRGSAKTGAK
jgi:hypothetical protein